MVLRLPDTGKEEFVIKFDKRIKPCGYYRISREDGDKTESDSIKNQRMMVYEFVSGNNLQLIDEYVDDGYTGTNFNRPSFAKLMDDIRDNKVNCIIVKDLSRLGRNYIEIWRMQTRSENGAHKVARTPHGISMRNWDITTGYIVTLINDGYDDYIKSKYIIITETRKLLELSDAHRNGHVGFALPISSIRILCERAGGAAGLLESLEASKGLKKENTEDNESGEYAAFKSLKVV